MNETPLPQPSGKPTEQATLLNACKAAYDELRYGSRSDALDLLEKVITTSKIDAHEQIVIEVKPAHLESVSVPGSAMNAGLAPSDDLSPNPEVSPWTPEPWEIVYDNDTGRDDDGFWEVWKVASGKFNCKEDADRAVACVNSLVGIKGRNLFKN